MTNTITLPRSVLEQALEALDEADLLMEHRQNIELRRSALAALRAALEQPQVEQEPFTVLVRKRSWLANQWEAAPCGFPDYGKQWADERINVYIHPQNLNCKSTQKRLATQWGFVPAQQPLTEFQIHECWHPSKYQFTRNIEAAHGITGETK